MKKCIYLIAAIAGFNSCNNGRYEKTPTVQSNIIPQIRIVGAMRNVMHEGELFGTIDLDTIADKNHLYAVAPLEYLKGEIMITDGRCFVSKVVSDTVISTEETYKVKAPFFVSSNVEQWYQVDVPDSVTNIRSLGYFLNAFTQSFQRPFAFKISAEIDSATVHVVNLPDGMQVHSPEEAHLNQKSFKIIKSNAEIIGFFSTAHAGVFIHHDSFVHMHLITEDKKIMGHIDELALTKGKFKLYLPQNKS